MLSVQHYNKKTMFLKNFEQDSISKSLHKTLYLQIPHSIGKKVLKQEEVWLCNVLEKLRLHRNRKTMDVGGKGIIKGKELAR